MDRLPPELLLRIFGLLGADDVRQRGRLERVCQRWRHVMFAGGGWREVRRIATPLRKEWLAPIAQRCGAHLVECCFYSMDLDPDFFLQIVRQFPALRHIEFHFCQWQFGVTNEALDTFGHHFGSKLRSLSFFETPYHAQFGDHLLPHLAHLQHLALHLSYHHLLHTLPRRFPADLRSLCLDSFSDFGTDVGLALECVQRDCARMGALFLRIDVDDSMLRRIGAIKSLRFLRIVLSPELREISELTRCLHGLPALRALHLTVPPGARFPVPLHQMVPPGLVHLHLSLPSYAHFPPALPATLHSLCLHYPAAAIHRHSGDIATRICDIVAGPESMEHLDTSCALFTGPELVQLVHCCPSLHTLRVRMRGELHIDALRDAVTGQWRAGERARLPLRLWLDEACAQWRDEFLEVQGNGSGGRTKQLASPVLAELFREEVFQGAEETPHFVTEHYFC